LAASGARAGAVGGFEPARHQAAAGFASGGADDFGKARAGADRIGEPPALDEGAAAARGAHQPAPGEFGDRAPHRVAIDREARGDLGFARQLLAGGDFAGDDGALEVVGDAPPQGHAGGRRARDHHLVTRSCHARIVAKKSLDSSCLVL
jgi:hypothetical protein